MAACAECGYQFDSLDHGAIVTALRSLTESHVQLLATSVPEGLRAHPREGSWSALEYACHVRDVLRFQRDRVLLAQAEDTPEFVSMRRDERAIEERYNDQDPEAVAVQLLVAATRLTETLGVLDDEGWQRTGMYNWPVREVRTVEWIGRHTVHELAHHLFDSRRLLGRRRGQR